MPGFLLLSLLSGSIVTAADPAEVFVVPNFHPASWGWLTDWSTERNYCANDYLDHLDRVRDDPNYAFALSECNNMIAILNFHPDRVAELKRRISEGRVELVNAFFLEPTINLSGGEALVKMGVEGLRWPQQVFGVRPGFGACIRHAYPAGHRGGDKAAAGCASQGRPHARRGARVGAWRQRRLLA